MDVYVYLIHKKRNWHKKSIKIVYMIHLLALFIITVLIWAYKPIEKKKIKARHALEIINQKIKPKSIRIKRNEMVRLINKDPNIYKIIISQKNILMKESPLLDINNTFDYLFENKGEYIYQIQHKYHNNLFTVYVL